MKAFKKLQLTHPLIARALQECLDECIAQNKFASQSELNVLRLEVFNLKYAKEGA